MSDWIYEGSSTFEVPPTAIGFIYLITQISTGKKYIGRKMLTKSVTKRVNGIPKKTRVESDWKTYWSSSPDLKEYIAEVGEHDFTREILIFVSSKGSMTYNEELALYLVGALESPDGWFNQNIRAKIYKSWVKPVESAALRAKIYSGLVV